MRSLDCPPCRPQAVSAAALCAGYSRVRPQHRRVLQLRCSAASPDASTAALPLPPGSPPSRTAPAPSNGSVPRGGAAAAHAVQVRPVEAEDYWSASDLHCSAFFPRATPFWFAALRVDRVMSLQLGKERPDLGNFLCLVAEGGGGPSPATAAAPAPSTPPPLKSFSNPRGEGAARVDLGPLVDALVALLFPPAMRRNYAATYGVRGLRGVVVVDSFGEHVPRRRTLMPNGTVRQVRRTAIAYLSNLAVAPCARRSGVGKRLLREAEQAAASWGCRSMALHVDPSNTAALQLYRSAGYRRVMEQPEWQRWLEGRQTPLVLMMRRLPRAAPGATAAADAAGEAAQEPRVLN